MIGQIIINGLLNGCVYALVAVGLSLTWGVMDIVNFAHGEFLLWGLYASFWIWALLGLDPLISMPIVIVLIFLLGVLTYLVVIKRVLKVSGLTALLATFGLSMVLKNLTQFFWTANYRNVTNTLVSNRSFKLLGMYIRQDYVVAAAGALIITLLVTCVGAAAALMASFTPIYPEACALYSTLAFVIVALGGFGNIKGALFAGLLVGVVEALGGYFIGTSFKYLVVFLLYLVVMQIRPRGLFGW